MLRRSSSALFPSRWEVTVLQDPVTDASGQQAHGQVLHLPPVQNQQQEEHRDREKNEATR
jgi:hypothetical protein